MSSAPVPFRLSMKALMLAPLPAPMVFAVLFTLGWSIRMPAVFYHVMSLRFLREKAPPAEHSPSAVV